MAVAVKNPPGVTSSPLDRPWVVSLLGVAYVLACFAIVFKLVPYLWWGAWDGLGLEKYQFLGGSLLGALMLAAGVGLLFVGGRLLGPTPPAGVRSGIFVGFAGIVFVLLLTRWASIWVEHWAYDNYWFSPKTGLLIVAATGVLFLALGAYLYTRPRTQRFILLLEEGGWFHATTYKPTQGLKVRRGTIFGLLMIVGAGIYTLISHGTLRRGPSDWHVDLPGTGKTTLVSLGDTQEWLEKDVPASAKNTVQVSRRGETDLPAGQTVSKARFEEKLKGVLTGEKFPADGRERIEKAGARDVLEELQQINKEYYAAIVVGMGRVQIKSAGSTDLAPGQVLAQKRFRDELTGRLAARQDDFPAKVREALNKANHEDDLPGLLKEIDAAQLTAAREALGSVRVLFPGKTPWKVKEVVTQKALREKVDAIPPEDQAPALATASHEGSLEALVTALDEQQRAALAKLVEDQPADKKGKKAPGFFDEKVTAELKKKLDAVKGKEGDDFAAVVAAFASAAEKAKKPLPRVLDLPVVAVKDRPLRSLTESRKLWAAEATGGLAGLVASFAKEARTNPTVPAVFHLPTGTVKDAPFFRGQKDIRELWEVEAPLGWMDLSPLIEKYVSLAAAAKKESSLPPAFGLPTGLLVLDRYALRDVNDRTDEKKNVKVDLPGASTFAPGQIVTPAEFDAEVKRLTDESLTPPTRASLSPATGPTRFESMTLLPSVQFTVPLLLLVASLWLAWRIVNIPAFADFLIATEAELNKVSWTTQRRLVQDTIVVLLTVFLMAVYLFAMDQGWRVLLSWKPVGVLVFPDDKSDATKKLEQKNW
jgi:preprotein translocase SecE subunit